MFLYNNVRTPCNHGKVVFQTNHGLECACGHAVGEVVAAVRPVMDGATDGADDVAADFGNAGIPYQGAPLFEEGNIGGASSGQNLVINRVPVRNNDCEVSVGNVVIKTSVRVTCVKLNRGTVRKPRSFP
jgi:hypothetical protein